MTHGVFRQIHVKSHERGKPGGGTTKVKGYDRQQVETRLSKKEINAIMAGRSQRAKSIDKKKRARIPKNQTAWGKRPGRYDLEGVDTP